MQLTPYTSTSNLASAQTRKKSATSTKSDNGIGLETGSILLIIVLPEVFSQAAQHTMHALQLSHKHSLPAPQKKIELHLTTRLIVQAKR